MTALTDEQVFAELYYSKKAIYDVLGITVECWRPPSGDGEQPKSRLKLDIELTSVSFQLMTESDLLRKLTPRYTMGHY